MHGDWDLEKGVEFLEAAVATVAGRPLAGDLSAATRWPNAAIFCRSQSAVRSRPGAFGRSDGTLPEAALIALWRSGDSPQNQAATAWMEYRRLVLVPWSREALRHLMKLDDLARGRQHQDGRRSR